MTLDRAKSLVKPWQKRKKRQIMAVTQSTQDTSDRLFEVMKNNRWWNWVNMTTRLYTNVSCKVWTGPGQTHKPMAVVPTPQRYAACGPKHCESEDYHFYL